MDCSTLGSLSFLVHLIISLSAATLCFRGQSSLNRVKATDANLVPLPPFLHPSPTLNPCAHSRRSELLKNHSRDFTNQIIIAWDNGNEENKEGVEITHDTGVYSLIREQKGSFLEVGTFPLKDVFDSVPVRGRQRWTGLREERTGEVPKLAEDLAERQVSAVETSQQAAGLRGGCFSPVFLLAV